MNEDIIFTAKQDAASPQLPSEDNIAPSSSSQAPSPQSLQEQVSLESKTARKSRLVLKIFLPILLLFIIVFFVLRFGVPLFLSNIPSGKVTITYWGLWEPKSVMQPIIQEFQRQYPNITVVYDQREIKQYKTTLRTRIANETGPDIFRFHNTWTSSMLDILSPIPASIIDSETFKKQYYPVVQSDMVVNGVLYGIPLHMDTLALFINDAIFADGGFSPPTTWEEFIRVALAATVKNEQGEIITSGAAIGTYNNIPHASDIISMLFAQNRVNLKNPSQSPEAVAEALSFYTNFASGRDNFESVWSSKQEDALSAFASGSVAMYFGFSWDIFAIKAKNPDLKFSVHKVPALTTPVSIASYWADGVSVKSKHQKEALLFLQFLAKKETQQKLYSEEAKIRLFGELPARRDLGESLAENTLIYPFIEQAKHAVSSPFASQTYDESLNDELNEYLQKAVNSILTTNTSPQSAAETFLQGVNQVFTRYGFK